MSLETLPEDIQSRLSGALTITTINQCVIELILNALDAKATAIAIQLNFRTFRVQVVDNGDGIPKTNLNLIALHYRTNKCQSLKDYRRRIKYHGYRGESLACMREICSKLSITSREVNSETTYLKVFEGKVSHKANVAKFRPSEGTTVTLENAFYNLPVRRKRIHPELDFDNLTQFLEALSIIYPNVSFSLRNDATTKMLFKNLKSNTVVDSLISLYPQLQKDSFLDIRFSKHKIRLSGLISKEKYPSGKLQLFYVNKRPIQCSKLQKVIISLFKSKKASCNSTKHDLYPIYALNIKCPYADVSLSFENNNYTANFVQFDIIKNFITNILETLKTKEQIEIVNASPINKVKDKDSDLESYAELSEICNLQGFVQSKIAHRNDAEVNANQKDSDIQSHSKMYEFDEQLQTNEAKNNSADAQSSSFKTIHDVEMSKQNSLLFNKEVLLKSFNAKERRNYSRNELIAHKDNIGNVRSNYHVQDIDNISEDFSQPILSRDPGEQLGKLEIMAKFLKATLANPNEPEGSTKTKTVYTDMKQMVKSSSGGLLNATSIVMQQSTTYTKTKNVLDTSMVSKLLTRTNSVLQKIQETKAEDKFAQTSFVTNKTLHFNNENTETYDKTNVYHINFNQLHLLGKGKLKVNVQLNKNNVDIKFDLNQSKYFNNTVQERESEEKRNVEEDEIVKTPCQRNNEKLQTLNQSKYFAVDNNHSVNKSSDETGRKCNDVTNDVISATFLEEGLDSVKDSTYYNMSKLNQLSFYNAQHNLEDSYLFPLKNTVAEDYPIWTDSSKIDDIDFNSVVRNHDLYKPSCSKDFHPPQPKNLTNIAHVHKKSLKRHSTDPFYQSINSLDDSKRRLKAFLSQEGCGSDENYQEFVDHLKKINESKGKFIATLQRSQNDIIISSNLIINNSTNAERQDVKIEMNRKETDVDKEWYTQNSGKFFVHKKTGLTTFKNPGTTKFDYDFKMRNEDIPKGTSPIITRADKCWFSLSQNRKDQLNAAILKSYENELDTVKWGNFIKDNDYKAFFMALFKSRNKNNPIQIPDLSKKIMPKILEKKYINSEQSKSFAVDLFSNLEVIGQLDQKFILAFYKYDQIIFAFDQHAVHERIRLERLQQSSSKDDKSFKSIVSNRVYNLNFTYTELECLMENRERIKNLGLYFTIFNENIVVNKIPVCLHNKFKKLPKNQDKEADVILQFLFEEILVNLKDTRGSLQVIPKVMQNILNSEACRGAIKFGEVLNNEDCQNLLNDLGRCNLPFQCAHGRPTLIPLIELTDNYHTLLEI